MANPQPRRELLIVLLVPVARLATLVNSRRAESLTKRRSKQETVRWVIGAVGKGTGLMVATRLVLRARRVVRGLVGMIGGRLDMAVLRKQVGEASGRAKPLVA